MSVISDKKQEIFHNVKVKVWKSDCFLTFLWTICDFPLVQAQNLTMGAFLDKTWLPGFALWKNWLSEAKPGILAALI